jgi:hypothetical protein
VERAEWEDRRQGDQKCSCLRKITKIFLIGYQGCKKCLEILQNCFQ